MPKRTKTSPVPPALRQRAEEFLQHTGLPMEETLGQDVQRLLHELQVHQIELEMQNEELRHTERVLEASRDSNSNFGSQLVSSDDCRSRPRSIKSSK